MNEPEFDANNLNQRSLLRSSLTTEMNYFLVIGSKPNENFDASLFVYLHHKTRGIVSLFAVMLNF